VRRGEPLRSTRLSSESKQTIAGIPEAMLPEFALDEVLAALRGTAQPYER
jgi:hypothetical protein